MENSEFTMEYVTPTLLSPKYRYAIARGSSCMEVNASENLDTDKVGSDL